MSEQVFIEFHTRWFYLPAIIALAFIVASLGIQHCYKDIKEFVKILDDDQKKVYNEIRKERENTYWCALMQGCFVAILYIIMTTLLCGCGRSKSLYHLVSDVLCIIFVTSYFVYTLKEKKKIMLIDGDLDDMQEKKWITIYRCMQKSFWGHFLMGLLFFGFVFNLLDILSPPVRVCINPMSIDRKKKQVSKRREKMR